MSSSGPDSKSIPPDLSEVDRGPFFNFHNLMKFADPIDGKALPCPKLIDNSKFESTLYTDSLNRVAKITLKPEITVSSSSKAVSEKPNADKPMDVDLIEDSDAKSSNSEIYGSILDLNPNFSISALVAEVNLEIEAFSQWGENKEMKSYWKGLSQNEKKNILLGLQFRLPGQPDSDKQSGSILNSLKEVQNLKKRNKVLRSWSNLELKQRVKMLRVQNLLRNQVKKEIKTKKKMTPLSSDLTPMKKKAIETSIGLNRISKKYQNPDNIPSVNNVFKVDVEEMSASPVNDKKLGKSEPKPQTKLVAAADLVQQVTKETKVEVKKPMSYADTVGKKKQIANLISVIKKDPKLKVGEVEMPIDDILKGSEPFRTTIYGYFIEKRVNYYKMKKYAMSKWKQFGIEGVMANEEGFYFFRFSSEQGVKEVLEGGPWLIFDNPIVIRRWTPGLNLSKSQHNSLSEGQKPKSDLQLCLDRGAVLESPF